MEILKDSLLKLTGQSNGFTDEVSESRERGPFRVWRSLCKPLERAQFEFWLIVSNSRRC